MREIDTLIKEIRISQKAENGWKQQTRHEKIFVVEGLRGFLPLQIQYTLSYLTQQWFS